MWWPPGVKLEDLGLARMPARPVCSGAEPRMRDWSGGIVGGWAIGEAGARRALDKFATSEAARNFEDKAKRFLADLDSTSQV